MVLLRRVKVQTMTHPKWKKKRNPSVTLLIDLVLLISLSSACREALESLAWREWSRDRRRRGSRRGTPLRPPASTRCSPAAIETRIQRDDVPAESASRAEQREPFVSRGWCSSDRVESHVVPNFPVCVVLGWIVS